MQIWPVSDLSLTPNNGLGLKNHVFEHDTWKSVLFPYYRLQINDFWNSYSKNLKINIFTPPAANSLLLQKQVWHITTHFVVEGHIWCSLLDLLFHLGWLFFMQICSWFVLSCLYSLRERERECVCMCVCACVCVCVCTNMHMYMCFNILKSFKSHAFSVLRGACTIMCAHGTSSFLSFKVFTCPVIFTSFDL